jgi:DNA repair exonuclease SbcCD ATPase subunit
MTTIKRFKCLGFALVILCGCNRHPVAAPLTAEDLRIARQALPLSDVSLLLRSGNRQEAIIAEVRKKRVSAAPDAATEDSLLRSGASPALIAALKARENLLTPNQKEAFDNFAADKTQRLQQDAASREQEALAAQQAEKYERQRRASAVEQTIQNARVGEEKERAYWQAWDTYKKQKEYLERRIVSLQNQINRRRSSYSYRENTLVEANQELDSLNEELRNLPAPPLR